MLKKAMKRIEQAAQARVGSAAEEACAAAKRRAPVETGRLRDSIHVVQEGLTARVVAGCGYAAAVEFGTQNAPAQPFMRG